MKASSVRSLRAHLGVTQVAFARLIGASFVSVNCWENEHREPHGLNLVKLELLSEALRSNTADTVTTRLDAASGDSTELVRVLVRLADRQERAACPSSKSS